jgi:hypothetical protein
MSSEIIAEETAVTQRSVVSGLGYPNGREEISPEPTGWQATNGEIDRIQKKVSRETI